LAPYRQGGVGKGASLLVDDNADEQDEQDDEQLD